MNRREKRRLYNWLVTFQKGNVTQSSEAVVSYIGSAVGTERRKIQRHCTLPLLRPLWNQTALSRHYGGHLLHIGAETSQGVVYPCLFSVSYENDSFSDSAGSNSKKPASTGRRCDSVRCVAHILFKLNKCYICIGQQEPRAPASVIDRSIYNILTTFLL